VSRRSTALHSALPAAVHAALACAALLLVTACDGGEQPRGELLVAAASDLALAMPQLAAEFEEASGIAVRATLGSSGQLAQQVLQGAPVDIFLSADRGWVERLAAAGRVAPDGRAVYARGLLVLVTAAHRPPLAGIAELAAPAVRRVAIANPEHAPYGRAAREALQSAGVWDALDGRIIIAENVRQALQFVGTGNVDAAVAALTLVSDDAAAFVIVPETLHAPLVQEAAVIAGRPLQAEAAEFLRFLTGPRGRAILERHRFILPDAPR
jgi:molybdate transport system substrate-binding protein